MIDRVTAVWREPRGTPPTPLASARGGHARAAAPVGGSRAAPGQATRRPCRLRHPRLITASLQSDNVTPVTSHRLPAAAVRAVDEYAETVLACPPALARRGGVNLLAESRRGLPTWHGYTMPIVGLSFAAGAVIACRPDLTEQLQAELGSDLHQPPLDDAGVRRLWAAV